MRTPLYKQYANTPAIGYHAWTAWGALLILDIEYDIDDHVIACMETENGRQQIRRHKICYTPNGRPFIWKTTGGIQSRWYFDNIMRI